MSTEQTHGTKATKTTATPEMQEMLNTVLGAVAASEERMNKRFQDHLSVVQLQTDAADYAVKVFGAESLRAMETELLSAKKPREARAAIYKLADAGVKSILPAKDVRKVLHIEMRTALAVGIIGGAAVAGGTVIIDRKLQARRAAKASEPVVVTGMPRF